MRTHHSIAVFVLTLSLAAPFLVVADDKTDGEGNPNWRDHLREKASQGPLKSDIRGSHLGTAVPEGAAARKIVITPRTKYANVKRDEVVTFQNGDKSFTWKFDTLGTPNFPLAEIAPKDFGTGHVRIYVDEVRDS